MASNTINFSLRVDADIESAKNNLDALKKELIQLQSTKYDPELKLDEEFKKASSAAQELQKHLKAGTDNFGNFNIAGFAQSLKTSNKTITELGASLLSAGGKGFSAFEKLTNQITLAQKPAITFSNILQKMGVTLANNIRWQISSSAINAVTGSLQEAWQYTKQMDEALTNIAVVTGKSRQEVSYMTRDLNKMAKELKTTTLELAKGQLIFYQQGDSAKLAAEKARITTMAANVSFESSQEEMSDYLTAVWNSYQVGEDQLEVFVDKLAAVGAATATSMEEIATAMTKVAAAANSVGVTYDQLNATIATISSVTRVSAETVGTAMKTIYARMGDLKIGKEDEDGMTYGQVSSQMKQMNIDILDAEGNLRDMGEVVEEIGNKWKTFSKEEQTALAQAMAGKRQYTNLLSLFDNWDMYLNTLETSKNATGTLQKQQEIWAQSWEGAANRVKNSTQQLFTNLLNSDFIIKATNFLATFIDGIDQVIKAFGGLGPILLQVGAFLGRIFNVQIVNYFSQKIMQLRSLFNWKAMLQNNLNDLTKIKNLDVYKNLNDGQKKVIDAYLDMAEIRAKFLANEKNLTEEQKLQYEALLEIYKLNRQSKEDIAGAIDESKSNFSEFGEQKTSREIRKEGKPEVDPEQIKRDQEHLKELSIDKISKDDSRRSFAKEKSPDLISEIERLKETYGSELIEGKNIKILEGMAQKSKKPRFNGSLYESAYKEVEEILNKIEKDKAIVPVEFVIEESTVEKEVDALSKKIASIDFKKFENLGIDEAKKALQDLGFELDGISFEDFGLDNEDTKITEDNLQKIADKLAEIGSQNISEALKLEIETDVFEGKEMSGSKKRMTKQSVSNLNELGFSNTEIDQAILGAQILRTEDLGESFKKVKTQIGENIYGDALKGSQKDIEMLRKALKDLSPDIELTDIENLEEKLKEAGIAADDLKAKMSTMAIDQCFEDAEGDIEKVKNGLKDLGITEDEIEKAFSDSLLDGLQLNEDQIKEIIEKLKENKRLKNEEIINDEVKDRADLRRKEEDVDEEGEKIKEQMEKDILPSKLEGTVQAFSDFSTIATAAAGAVSTLTNAFGVLNDENASTKDKIMTMGGALLSIVTTIVTTVIPTFISMGAAQAAAFWQITAIMAVIAAVIALTTVMVVGFMNIYNAADNAAKAMEEQANRTKEAFDSANNSLQELKDSFSDYSDKQSAIDKMKEGTLEFKQAILESNMAMLDMIEKYPILVQYIETINGRIRLKKGAESAAIEAQTEIVNQAYETNLATQMAAKRLRQEVDEQKLAGNLFVGEMSLAGFKRAAPLVEPVVKGLMAQNVIPLFFAMDQFIRGASDVGNDKLDELDIFIKAVETHGVSIMSSYESLEKALDGNSELAKALWDNKESVMHVAKEIEQNRLELRANTEQLVITNNPEAAKNKDLVNFLTNRAMDSDYAEEVKGKIVNDLFGGNTDNAYGRSWYSFIPVPFFGGSGRLFAGEDAIKDVWTEGQQNEIFGTIWGKDWRNKHEMSYQGGKTIKVRDKGEDGKWGEWYNADKKTFIEQYTQIKATEGSDYDINMVITKQKDVMRIIQQNESEVAKAIIEDFGGTWEAAKKAIEDQGGNFLEVYEKYWQDYVDSTFNAGERQDRVNEQIQELINNSPMFDGFMEALANDDTEALQKYLEQFQQLGFFIGYDLEQFKNFKKTTEDGTITFEYKWEENDESAPPTGLVAQLEGNGEEVESGFDFSKVEKTSAGGYNKDSLKKQLIDQYHFTNEEIDEIVEGLNLANEEAIKERIIAQKNQRTIENFNIYDMTEEDLPFIKTAYKENIAAAKEYEKAIIGINNEETKGIKIVEDKIVFLDESGNIIENLEGVSLDSAAAASLLNKSLLPLSSFPGLSSKAYDSIVAAGQAAGWSYVQMNGLLNGLAALNGVSPDFSAFIKSCIAAGGAATQAALDAAALQGITVGVYVRDDGKIGFDINGVKYISHKGDTPEARAKALQLYFDKHKPKIDAKKLASDYLAALEVHVPPTGDMTDSSGGGDKKSKQQEAFEAEKKKYDKEMSQAEDDLEKGIITDEQYREKIEKAWENLVSAYQALSSEEKKEAEDIMRQESLNIRQMVIDYFDNIYDSWIEAYEYAERLYGSESKAVELENRSANALKTLMSTGGSKELYDVYHEWLEASQDESLSQAERDYAKTRATEVWDVIMGLGEDYTDYHYLDGLLNEEQDILQKDKNVTHEDWQEHYQKKLNVLKKKLKDGKITYQRYRTEALGLINAPYWDSAKGEYLPIFSADERKEMVEELNADDAKTAAEYFSNEVAHERMTGYEAATEIMKIADQTEDADIKYGLTADAIDQGFKDINERIKNGEGEYSDNLAKLREIINDDSLTDDQKRNAINKFRDSVSASFDGFIEEIKDEPWRLEEAWNGTIEEFGKIVKEASGYDISTLTREQYLSLLSADDREIIEAGLKDLFAVQEEQLYIGTTDWETFWKNRQETVSKYGAALTEGEKQMYLNEEKAAEGFASNLKSRYDKGELTTKQYVERIESITGVDDYFKENNIFTFLINEIDELYKRFEDDDITTLEDYLARVKAELEEAGKWGTELGDKVWNEALGKGATYTSDKYKAEYDNLITQQTLDDWGMTNDYNLGNTSEYKLPYAQNWYDQEKANLDYFVKNWKGTGSILDDEGYQTLLKNVQAAKDNLKGLADEHIQFSLDWIAHEESMNRLTYADKVDAYDRILARIESGYYRQMFANEEEYINWQKAQVAELRQSKIDAAKAEADQYANILKERFEDEKAYYENLKSIREKSFEASKTLREQQYEINKELQNSLTMYEYLDNKIRESIFNEEDYLKLSEEIADIQTEINDLTHEYEKELRTATTEEAELLTAEYERQVELKLKEFDIAKANLEITKKQMALQNTLNERNTRMFINGQWTWVANQENVARAREELMKAEYDAETATLEYEHEQAMNQLDNAINNIQREVNKIDQVLEELEKTLSGEDGLIVTFKKLNEAASTAKTAYNNKNDILDENWHQYDNYAQSSKNVIGEIASRNMLSKNGEEVEDYTFYVGRTDPSGNLEYETHSMSFDGDKRYLDGIEVTDDFLKAFYEDYSTNGMYMTNKTSLDTAQTYALDDQYYQYDEESGKYTNTKDATDTKTESEMISGGASALTAAQEGNRIAEENKESNVATNQKIDANLTEKSELEINTLLAHLLNQGYSGDEDAGILVSLVESLVIKDLFDKLDKIWNKLDDIEAATRNVSSAIKNISFNAQGNIVNRPTLSWIGEDGPEAIIPLSQKYRDRGLSLWEEATKALGIAPSFTMPTIRTSFPREKENMNVSQTINVTVQNEDSSNDFYAITNLL